MSNIAKLIQESTTSVANMDARPELLSLTRAVNNLIYTDLVAIQSTRQPLAALYGLGYINPQGELTYRSAATYGGKIGDRTDIADVQLDKSYNKDEVFKHKNVVYIVISPIQLDTLAPDKDKAIFKAIMNSKIRFYGDAAPRTQFEDKNTKICETDMAFHKWQVPVNTRKLKTEFTQELLQDLEANQMDSEAAVYDLLATVASEEINKDIIQKLVTVSKRYAVEGLSDGGIISMTGVSDSASQARMLYRMACEMSAYMLRTTSFGGTYVLASSRVCGILAASGWMEESDNALSEGRLRCGLEVYSDTTSPFDYLLVGCKHIIGEMEHVGSLFYSPYEESDGAGAYKTVIDPSSFQHRIAVMNRYALSVNPYTAPVADDEDPFVVGDDWEKLAGRSDMSCIVGIELPALKVADTFDF